VNGEHEEAQAQVKKLRRRIEEILRKSDVRILIMIADLLNIKVQKDLRDKHQ
jgi:3-deoxy-D-arabino-heptulosonate 7-phosphate (DAHP) synthase